MVTAENTIIGGNATGIGTLNVQDQDSVITVRRLYNGYFGNGTVNISNNGLINNKEYSLVGVQDGSHGVVNVTDKGHWNFLGTGEAFRYIYIGDAGDGELNVSSEGKVDSGIITAGMKETGTGNITVKDKNSVITNLGTNLGYDGPGEMNISNQGLVVSNGGSSLGYGETGVGNVSITTGECGRSIRMSIPPLVLRASETSILAMAVSSYRKILLFWAIKQAVSAH